MTLDTRFDSNTVEELILTKREVVALVKASFPTIWARIKAGEFPPARNRGGQVYWIRTEIEAYLLDAPVVIYGGRKGKIWLEDKSQPAA